MHEEGEKPTTAAAEEPMVGSEPVGLKLVITR